MNFVAVETYISANPNDKSYIIYSGKSLFAFLWHRNSNFFCKKREVPRGFSHPPLSWGC